MNQDLWRLRHSVLDVPCKDRVSEGMWLPPLCSMSASHVLSQRSPELTMLLPVTVMAVIVPIRVDDSEARPGRAIRSERQGCSLVLNEV